jgi:two-component system, sensor histidine kinase RegB
MMFSVNFLAGSTLYSDLPRAPPAARIVGVESSLSKLAPVDAGNLRRMVILRAVVVLIFAATLSIAARWLNEPLPLAPLALAFGALIALTVLAFARLRAGAAVGETEVFAHLVLDVMVFSFLLDFVGGGRNPLITLLLLPLVVAATLLHARHIWALAALVGAAYTFLMGFSRPLPHAHGALGEFDLHLIGMWATFLLSAAIVATLIARMAAGLRERDARLARAREEMLRNERVVALGTLAAGAAHELGTPLATIAVIAGELEHELAGEDDLRADLRALQVQVVHCKRIITELAHSAGVDRLEEGALRPVDAFVAQTLEQWRLMRPGVRVKVSPTREGAPSVLAEPTLRQALLNVLNNAADASLLEVEVITDWSIDAVTIEVLDRGDGLTPRALTHAGNEVFSTKPPDEGAGIGLLLARAALERLGGSLALANRPQGGVQAKILLPAR